MKYLKTFESYDPVKSLIEMIESGSEENIKLAIELAQSQKLVDELKESLLNSDSLSKIFANSYYNGIEYYDFFPNGKYSGLLLSEKECKDILINGLKVDHIKINDVKQYIQEMYKQKKLHKRYNLVIKESLVDDSKYEIRFFICFSINPKNYFFDESYGSVHDNDNFISLCNYHEHTGYNGHRMVRNKYPEWKNFGLYDSSIDNDVLNYINEKIDYFNNYLETEFIHFI